MISNHELTWRLTANSLLVNIPVRLRALVTTLMIYLKVLPISGKENNIGLAKKKVVPAKHL